MWMPLLLIERKAWIPASSISTPGARRGSQPVSSSLLLGPPSPGSSWSGPRVGRCRAGDTAKRQEVPVFHPLADRPLGVHSQTRCQLWRP